MLKARLNKLLVVLDGCAFSLTSVKTCFTKTIIMRYTKTTDLQIVKRDAATKSSDAVAKYERLQIIFLVF